MTFRVNILFIMAKNIDTSNQTKKVCDNVCVCPEMVYTEGHLLTKLKGPLLNLREFCVVKSLSN